MKRNADIGLFTYPSKNEAAIPVVVKGKKATAIHGSYDLILSVSNGTVLKPNRFFMNAQVPGSDNSQIITAISFLSINYINKLIYLGVRFAT